MGLNLTVITTFKTDYLSGHNWNLGKISTLIRTYNTMVNSY